MSFIVSSEITLIGMFAPNGFQTIRPGADVKIVFDNYPGRIFSARVTTIARGVGQGQVAASGMLAKAGAVRGADAYPVEISIPNDYDRAELRLGMPGTAMVFSPEAGVFGSMKYILVWINSYTAYL